VTPQTTGVGDNAKSLSETNRTRRQTNGKPTKGKDPKTAVEERNKRQPILAREERGNTSGGREITTGVKETSSPLGEPHFSGQGPGGKDREVRLNASHKRNKKQKRVRGARNRFTLMWEGFDYPIRRKGSGGIVVRDTRGGEGGNRSRRVSVSASHTGGKNRKSTRRLPLLLSKKREN